MPEKSSLWQHRPEKSPPVICSVAPLRRNVMTSPSRGGQAEHDQTIHTPAHVACWKSPLSLRRHPPLNFCFQQKQGRVGRPFSCSSWQGRGSRLHRRAARLLRRAMAKGHDQPFAECSQPIPALKYVACGQEIPPASCGRHPPLLRAGGEVGPSCFCSWLI